MQALVRRSRRAKRRARSSENRQKSPYRRFWTSPAVWLRLHANSAWRVVRVNLHDVITVRPVRVDKDPAFRQPLNAHHDLGVVAKIGQQMRWLPAFCVTAPDPRRAQGRGHPLRAVLAIAAAAVLRRTRGYQSIAAWAQGPGQAARRAVLLAPLKTLPSARILSGYPSALYDEQLAERRRLALQLVGQAGVRTEQLWLNLAPDRVHRARCAGKTNSRRSARAAAPTPSRRHLEKGSRRVAQTRPKVTPSTTCLT